MIPKIELKAKNGSWWLCFGNNEINTYHSSARKGGFRKAQVQEMCAESIKELEAQLKREGTESPWAPPKPSNHRSPFGMGS